MLLIYFRADLKIFLYTETQVFKSYKIQTMRKHLHVTLFLSINLLGCSLFSADLPASEPAIPIPCPIDSCQKVSIELSLQGLNYSASFTCYEWTDWGTGLYVDWRDGGRILFFTFPNHRICKPEFRICTESQCDCIWQPIESCLRNNTLTLALDTCLFGQPNLFLDLFLEDK
jgi:hypothetical protein